MKLSHKYKKVYTYEVVKWVENSVPDLTDYQKNRLHIESETYPFYSFKFVSRSEGVGNFMWRFTLPLIPIFLLLIVVSLPFKYVCSGEWGYGNRFVDYWHRWMQKLGF